MSLIIKFLIGFALLPATWATSIWMYDLLQTLANDKTWLMSPSLWGLLIGFALWLLIYMVMPRPMRTYVLAHELTHALWAWALGARVSGIKVGKSGGHVRLSHTNFLITLAPYFFPLYTVLVILLFFILGFFYEVGAFIPIWMGWIGLTWGFHFTFTLSTLKTRQPDIQENGRLFSYVIIYLFNLTGIAVWVLAVTGGAWSSAMKAWQHLHQQTYLQVWLQVQQIAAQLADQF